MIRYQFKVKLYNEREYILYEKEEGKFTVVLLKPINALHEMAKFVRSEITSYGKTKVRYYLIGTDWEPGWTDHEFIALEEAKAYLEKLS